SNPTNEATVTTPPAQGLTLSDADVGAPSLAGGTSVVTSGSAYDVTGGGSDVWSTSDQFHYAYTQVTGDFDIKTRVNAATFASGTNPLLGLMARESLDANSRNIFMRTYGQSGGAYKLAS